ncbi:MAG: DNA-directed RNA polymerase subunit beta' [Phycisphaerales bacterium]
MLQQAVDALDNGRCCRPVLGSSNRPLKSITDMIKGKQAASARTCSASRVDYSALGHRGRSGFQAPPVRPAQEDRAGLFQLFIIRKLKEHGLADTIKSAKRMLERRDPEVWDILEQVIHLHPVLLNRAPTLHRMGIQAFEPVLVEGNAIKIHPLVCTGYNADFDGDQMAVHLPLSVEAQAEAHVLMLSTHNIFSPANGNPIVSPSQDIVMGVYFLTVLHPEYAALVETIRAAADPIVSAREEGVRFFKDPFEAMLAHDLKEIALQQPIVVRLPRFSEIVESEKGSPSPMPAHRRIVTTVGRLIFSEILANGMPFYNCALGKKGCARVIDDTYERLGRPRTIDLLDDMKETGFKASTTSGLSFGITDLRVPEEKFKLIAETQKKVDRVERAFENGAITERERHNQLLDLWAQCREQVVKKLVETLKNDRRDPATGKERPIDSKEGVRYLNPVFLFSDSGARGNISQMQQLAGMRGLMAKPSGEIIETPIKANFREGLNVLEYFSSTHGARKGLADTALKTADSGYLTRKLCDVAQSVVVVEEDCGTSMGISKRAIYRGEEVDVPLRDAIVGRTTRENIVNPITDEVIVEENGLITDDVARKIEALGIRSVSVRSSLTCNTARGVCQKCYGMDMSTGSFVELGMAVGIIAAQSIGEPGTQLTMRTFHTGGIAARGLAETMHKASNAGIVALRDCNEVVVDHDGVKLLTALRRNGTVALVDEKGRELEKHPVPYGATITVKPGEHVKKGQLLVEWDPHRTPILAEKSGVVRFKDIVEDETVRREDAKGGGTELIVIEHTGEKHPQITIEDDNGQILDFHHLPAKARIEVKEGQRIKIGQMLARQPKETAKSADIVGGLPRVTEIFEARVPRDPAVMAEISGRVELHSDKRKGKMTVRVVSEAGLEHDHHVPQGTHLLVHTGDHVTAGDPLTEGPMIPADILRIKGEDALYVYMLDEVQNVYRAQGVPISDKHIEVILRQMLSKVRVQSPGDTDLLPNDVIDKFVFRQINDELADKLKIVESGDTGLAKDSLVAKDEVREANARAEADGKQPCKTKKPRPASVKTLLLGITKASLQAESFLSGASFQETTKVLTEAALKGAVDNLLGLKENVLLGHLIPAGTGFDPYAKLKVRRLAEAPAEAGESDASSIAEAARKAESLGAERGSEKVAEKSGKKAMAGA